MITNHETIANQTEIVTPSNTKFKRTVLHTPAIIETIVDTPEVPVVSAPVVRHAAPPVEYVSRVPVGRVESTVTRGVPIGFSGVGVRPREEVRRGAVVRGGEWEREIGVKVNEDLSGFRPSVGVRHEEGKRAGGCGGILGYCWGNRCPFWVFILVPVLLVLAVLGVSSFVKKHRVFYGYDTSTMGRMGEIGVERTGGAEVVAPIVSTDQAGTGTGVGIDHNGNTGINTGINTGLNTNLNPAVDPNLDPNINSLTPNLNLHPTTTTDLHSSTTTATRSLTGNDIYSQVLARQQHPLPSTSTST